MVPCYNGKFRNSSVTSSFDLDLLLALNALMRESSVRSLGRGELCTYVRTYVRQVKIGIHQILPPNVNLLLTAAHPHHISKCKLWRFVAG